MATNFNLSRLLVPLAFLVGVFTLLPTGEAQRKRGGFDVKAYLSGLDKNSNGLLETSEMKGRTSGFLKNLGFDTSKPVKLSDVVRKVDKDKKDAKESSSRKNKSEAKVPGFGVEREVKGVSDFSASVKEKGKSSGVSLEAQFGKNIMKQVDDVIRRYDRNKNSQLDADEIKRGRWGSPKPAESDLNRDGILTRSELANRYQAREKSVRTSRGRSNDRSSRKDSDRGRDSSRSSSNRRSSSSRSSSSRSTSSRSSSSRPSSTRSSSRSRSSSKSSSDLSSSREKSSSSKSSRYISYAKSLIKKYDKNNDGRLSKKEQEAMTAAPKASADSNKDGYISVEELAVSIGGGASVSTSSEKSKSDSKSSSTSKREKSRSRDRSSSRSSRKKVTSFSSGDTNNDGQINMHEYAKEWSSEELEEFEKRDLNNDGVITAQEWAKSRSGK